MENMLMNISKMDNDAVEKAIKCFMALGKSGLPEDFWDEDVQLAYNESSGYVFFTNSAYQVAIERDGKLVSWYFTPYEGHEGTLNDLINMVADGIITEVEDIEYIIGICEMLNRDEDSVFLKACAEDEVK